MIPLLYIFKTGKINQWEDNIGVTRIVHEENFWGARNVQM